MQRVSLSLPCALLLVSGCPGEATPGTSDDDNDGSTSSTTDPSTTLPPTTDTTTAPTTDTTTDGTTDTTTSSSSADPTTGATTSGTTESGGGDSSSGSSGEDSSSGGDSSSGDASSSSTGEVCAFLDCPDACVDPETNPDFCGATACEGKDSGVECSGSATCEAGECVESCDNCSFESGDFTGWTVADLSGPLIPAGVDETGTNQSEDFFGPVAATHGTYVAFNGFDGNGASDTGEISFGQDLAIREGATTLDFDYRIRWDLLNLAEATLDRTFEVHIEPQGGGAPIETVLVETVAFETVGDVTDTGSVDVSAYAGQTVFIKFVWTVPEDNSGPAQAELDNVHVLAE